MQLQELFIPVDLQIGVTKLFEVETAKQCTQLHIDR